MISDDLQYLQILQMRAERTVGPIESVCMYVNCIYAARLSTSTLVAPHTSLDTRWASVYIRVHMLRAQYETDACANMRLRRHRECKHVWELHVCH